jgi:hypothetical protein
MERNIMEELIVPPPHEELIVPSAHAEGAKALAEKIRALIAEIPRFTPEGPNDAKTLSATAALSEAFLESASVAIQKSPLLESAVRTNATALRDSFGFALSYDAVLIEAYALVRAVAHTIRFAKSTAGVSALDVYAIAQRLAKRKDGAELVPHVKDMRHKLKRGRRKATSEPAPDQPVTAAPKQ